jgi:hypothetical protein
MRLKIKKITPGLMAMGVILVRLLFFLTGR